MRGRPRIHDVGRYGVYLCPECGEPFSKEAKVKRTRCPRCLKAVDVQKLFAVYLTDDPRKAAEGVRYASLVGHRKAEAAGAHREIEAGTAKPAKPKRDYSSFCDAVAEMEGAITLERLASELRGYRRKELEKYLDRAAEEGLLVRCAKGYRAVA